MIIRHASIEDAQNIAAIHVASWQAAYAGIVPQSHLDRLSVDDRAAGWIRILEQGDSETVVAEISDTIAGFVSYGRSRDEDAAPGTGEVYAIYVAPAHWSSGVGYVLWQQARRDLVDQGYSRIGIWVLATNERAIQFYERIGFRLRAGSDTVVTIGGKELTEVRYEISIAAEGAT